MRGSSQALSYQNRVRGNVCEAPSGCYQCLRDTVSCQVRHMHDVRP